MVPEAAARSENGDMEFDLERVRENVHKATTEDLLDRATVYRAGLEPEALPVVLEELRARGVTPEAIVAHEGARQGVMQAPEGVAQKCHRCHRPAVTREWDWHRMFGRMPLFPRPFYLCEVHRTPSNNFF
jgi:hypothetical protein